MKKAKKTKAKKKASERKTALDRIVKQLHTILRRRTSDVVQAGKLLIQARKQFANEHGKWLDWLVDNFDLSPRTAQRYVAAAEYVQKRHVSHFANLSATVLYRLAEGDFDERVEAAILAEARKRRVGEDAMWAIQEKLEPADNDAEETDEAVAAFEANIEAAFKGGTSSGDEKDPESEAIIERGTDPAVPPTADPPPPTDFALRDFNQAIDALNRLKTKQPTQFAKTTHSAEVLYGIEAFIHAVMKAIERDSATPEQLAAAVKQSA